MSRRDTIIVAALINAGILIILFVSALKNPGASETIATTPEPQSQASFELSTRSESKAVIGDEVDQVLSQYSKQNSQPSSSFIETASTSVISSDLSSQMESPAFVQPVEPNFVDDLNALAKASESSSLQEPATEVNSPSTANEVRVKKGDVLEKIARNHQTTVQELMRINKLSSTSLKIGQVLKIPARAQVNKIASAPSVQAPQVQDGSAKFYVVKSGDNPWTIAVKNHIKVEDLLRLNNMDEAKARKLKPGDQIRIK